MCDKALIFDTIFSRTKNIRFNSDPFPDIKIIGWFCVNISASLILCVCSIIFLSSLLTPKLHYTSSKNKSTLFKLFYVPYTLSIVLIFSVFNWHSFDLGEKSICYFKNATCDSHCEFEIMFSDILIENIKNFVSWRPLFVTICFILSFIPLPLLYVDKTNNIFGFFIFLVYFSLSLFFGVTSFFVQGMCGKYNTYKCDCLPFSTGMANFCKIPLFELSIFVSICYLSYLLQIKRNFRKKRATIHDVSSVAQNNIEFIDLPNNRQYNYMQSGQYVRTTRDKWYDIVGF